jgi:hypothetical protein
MSAEFKVAELCQKIGSLTQATVGEWIELTLDIECVRWCWYGAASDDASCSPLQPVKLTRELGADVEEQRWRILDDWADPARVESTQAGSVTSPVSSSDASKELESRAHAINHILDVIREAESRVEKYTQVLDVGFWSVADFSVVELEDWAAGSCRDCALLPTCRAVFKHNQLCFGNREFQVPSFAPRINNVQCLLHVGDCLSALGAVLDWKICVQSAVISIQRRLYRWGQFRYEVVDEDEEEQRTQNTALRDSTLPGDLSGFVVANANRPASIVEVTFNPEQERASDASLVLKLVQKSIMVDCVERLLDVESDKAEIMTLTPGVVCSLNHVHQRVKRSHAATETALSFGEEWFAFELMLKAVSDEFFSDFSQTRKQGNRSEVSTLGRCWRFGEWNDSGWFPARWEMAESQRCIQKSKEVGFELRTSMLDQRVGDAVFARRRAGVELR